LLHVRDASHPEAEGQKADVEAVLESLGVGMLGERMIEVLNKIDRVDPEGHEALLEQAKRHHPAVAISATTGEGCDRLIETMQSKLRNTQFTLAYRIPHDQGAASAWLYAHGEVLERQDEDVYSELTTRLSPEDAERFERRFGITAVLDGNEEAERGHG
jgi:GTP-binding protein HflX